MHKYIISFLISALIIVTPTFSETTQAAPKKQTQEIPPTVPQKELIKQQELVVGMARGFTLGGILLGGIGWALAAIGGTSGLPLAYTVEVFSGIFGFIGSMATLTALDNSLALDKSLAPPPVK